MRKTIAELVAVLCDEHDVEVRGGRLHREDGLIPKLRESMRASMGMTHGGHSLAHERSTLNLAAFTLYEHVTFTAGLMLGQVLVAGDDPVDRRDPEGSLRRWLEEWTLAVHRGETNDAQEALARRRLSDLAARIDQVLAPTRVAEILGACPNPGCGERYWPTDTQGSRTSALYAVLVPGEPVQARCHWCDTQWTGEAELEQLNTAINRQEKTA